MRHIYILPFQYCCFVLGVWATATTDHGPGNSTAACSQSWRRAVCDPWDAPGLGSGQGSSRWQKMLSRRALTGGREHLSAVSIYKDNPIVGPQPHALIKPNHLQRPCLQTLAHEGGGTVQSIALLSQNGRKCRQNIFLFCVTD